MFKRVVWQSTCLVYEGRFNWQDSQTQLYNKTVEKNQLVKNGDAPSHVCWEDVYKGPVAGSTALRD